MNNKDAYVLRFTREEYCRMIEDIQKGDYTLYVEIVDRILKMKFKNWKARSIIQMYDLAEDLHSEVIMCLIKEARNLINRDGHVIDPHYFQALVYTVARGRAVNFIDREKYAHGDLSGNRFERLRQVLGLEDDGDEAEDVLGKKRTYIPMISIETGGYTEDGEERAFDIPDPDSGMTDLEAIDEYESMIRRANAAIATCKLSAHRVLTWFLYVTSLRCNWYDAALTKAWMEQQFADKTLYELAAHIAAYPEIVYTVRVSEDQLALLKMRLEQPADNGIAIGDTTYGGYRMEGKTMRATISDWINRWNTWLKEKHIL